MYMHRRCFGKLCTFYQIFKNKSPRYVYELLPLQTTSLNARSSRNVSLFHFKHNYFKNSFFPFVIIEWKNLHKYIQNSESLSIFLK